MKPARVAPRLSAALVLVFLASALLGCRHTPPEATPEGAVRLWLERMEASTDDLRAAKEAYAVLGPASRANLQERAERASRVQGRRVEPEEMLAEGRFGLKFRPKSMTATVHGEEAEVAVSGDDPSVEHATVHCVEERGLWRVEPGLPDVSVLPRWRDAGP